MINLNYRNCLCGLVMLLLFNGCSYIKSLFPDKERDYQFRTEIPDLVIPEDLKTQPFPIKQNPAAAIARPPAAVSAPVAPSSQAAAVANTQSANPLPQSAVPSAPKEAVVSDPKLNNASSVEVTNPSAANNVNVSGLQIDQPQNQAWRLVARALSRQKIEIVERNMDKGYFYVKYDPDEVKSEDNSFWDELAFLMGDDPSHELEYRISLLEIAPQLTEVTIQSSDGQTLSNRTATHLLKLITDGINLDLTNGAPPDENKPTPAAAPQ